MIDLPPLGARIHGEVRTSNRTFAVHNPADGSVLAQVPNTPIDECVEAVMAAHSAFKQWRSTAPRERGEILRSAFELMTAEIDYVAELMVLENGKTLADARSEAIYAADFLRWNAEESVRLYGDFRTAPSGANWIVSQLEPVGVALCITPWNFPAAMVTRKVAPALAAGCTVVVKAPAETPLTALYLTDLFARAGLPSGVINTVVPDPPGDAVQAMLETGRVRKLSFTGSTLVGGLLLAQAAPRIINTAMELGGNASFIVLEGADVDSALDAAMVAKLRNGGAACTAANRFFVHESVRSDFTTGLVERMGQQIVGPGLDPATTLGPMVTAAQQQRLRDVVTAAERESANVLVGGTTTNDSGFGFNATVLDGLAPTAEVLRQELFGPIAPIVGFEDENDMIGWANDVEVGLVSYVCGPTGACMRVAQGLEVGMVGINRGFISDVSAPFGGVKGSGIGREGGHEGVLAFCETKYIAGTW